MKRILFFIFVSFSFCANAQDKINLDFAQVFSGFKFKDSQGNKDAYLSTDIKFSYGLSYIKTFKNGLYIKPELRYKNMGANSSVDNTKIQWDLNYIDFNLGGGYVFNKYRLKPFIGAAFYYAYMFKGSQSVGSDSYDLIKNKALSTTDYGVNINLGLRYDFSENAGVFFEYRNSTGLCQLDKNIDGGSKELYNKSSSFHFGLAFSIVK